MSPSETLEADEVLALIAAAEKALDDLRRFGRGVDQIPRWQAMDAAFGAARGVIQRQRDEDASSERVISHLRSEVTSLRGVIAQQRDDIAEARAEAEAAFEAGKVAYAREIQALIRTSRLVR